MAIKKVSKKQIQEYINLYSIETYLYETVGVKAKKRGFLRFSEFFDICMWKSSRPKKRYLKNKKIVEKITKKAFAETDEIKKIKLLCTLDGIAIPTASALLSVVYPEKYPIIDIRCLEQLNFLGHNISKYVSEKIWIRYLEIMRTFASQSSKTPREIDMALFAMHRETLNKNGHHNLYSREK